MSRLVWGNPGTRLIETGIDRAVLYVDGRDPVVWHGITEIREQPTGGKARPYYIDGVKYQNVSKIEEFAGTISAFYSPEAFDECDGSLELSQGVLAGQQLRRAFGMSFRTGVGNDTEDLSHGYKLHIVYNALARPTTRSNKTHSSSSDVDPFSWSFTTKPVPFPGLLPTSHIWFDTTKIDPWVLAHIEDVLYGTETTDPRLPYPEEILDILLLLEGIVVTDLGDGEFSVEGPEGVVISLDGEGFSIDWPTAVNHDSLSFSVSSA